MFIDNWISSSTAQVNLIKEVTGKFVKETEATLARVIRLGVWTDGGFKFRFFFKLFKNFNEEI